MDFLEHLGRMSLDHQSVVLKPMLGVTSELSQFPLEFAFYKALMSLTQIYNFVVNIRSLSFCF
jgi:membrane protein insertase Oxa1/YidC/SpoIIIJ